MTIGFPTNTVVFIVLSMIATGTGAWVILSRGLSRAPIAQSTWQRWRLGAAIFLMAWLLTRLALAAYPPGEASLADQTSITFISLGFGLLVGVLLLLSPVFRQAVRAVPETWLVGLHAARLFGFMFLALMDMKLLPPPFALSAGYGDVATGLMALGVVYLLAQRKPSARALLVGWNVFGLLDFVTALVTGGLFIAPFAAQVAASGVALHYLNYVLIIPSFGVPLYASLHIYSLFQVLTRRAEARVGETIYSQRQRPASS